MIAENQKDVLEHTHEDGFTHSHFGAVNHTHKAIDKSPPIALWCGSGGENHGESLSYFFTSKLLFIWKRDEKISQVTDFTEVVDEVTNSTVFESVDFKAPNFLTESPIESEPTEIIFPVAKIVTRPFISGLLTYPQIPLYET